MFSLITVFLRITSIIPSWVYFIALAGLVTTNAITNHRLNNARSELVAVKADYAKEAAIRASVALTAEQNNRKIEQERQEHVNKIITSAVEEKNKTAIIASRLAADNSSMRNKLTSYATGGGSSASNPGAPADIEKRSAALGVLLATCREQEIGDAGELEELATQTRGLISAYEGLDSTTVK